jgi:hypothetical protein
VGVAVNEKPIIFSAPMVRAILDGRKTQTRRLIKPQPLEVLDAGSNTLGEFINQDGKNIRCPYGLSANYGNTDEERRGDRLWVRENWQAWAEFDKTRADDIPDEMRKNINYPANGNSWYARTRPSIHMPRWASRITLEVTSVRVQQLQKITPKEAIAEGLECCSDGYRCLPMLSWNPNPVRAFHDLWGQIHGYASWDSNPWVWVIEFRRV